MRKDEFRNYEVLGRIKAWIEANVKMKGADLSSTLAKDNEMKRYQRLTPDKMNHVDKTLSPNCHFTINNIKFSYFSLGQADPNLTQIYLQNSA